MAHSSVCLARSADETDHFAVGKMPTTSVPHLSVEPLLRAVRSDLGPVLDRERTERKDVISGVEQHDSDVVEPGSGELVDDVAELVLGGVPVGLLEDRPHQRGDHRPRR
jgi:hypothetical protein